MAEEGASSSEYVFFWKIDQDNGYLSQWYPSPFKAEVEIEEGKREMCTFATAEHWMMVQKALLFGDRVIAREILALPAGSKNMKAVKALGRRVQNFEEEMWVRERYRIVVEGNRHKFLAHETLREQLAGTGEKGIVEASPLDRIWGVGFGAKNAEKQKERWGQNLLGQALEQVRREIGA